MRRIACFVLGVSAACGGSASESSPAAVASVAPPSENDRAAWAKSQNLEIKQFDLNRDGVPDVFKFYRLAADPKNPGNQLEELVRKDTDLNHDGKVDIVRIYGQDQKLVEERSDLDFDGRFDELAYYEAGVLVRKTIDLNYDEKPDVTKYYAEDKLVRIESDKNEDGQIDTWEYFEGGELDRIGTDKDLDGNADHWEKKRKTVADAGTTDAPDEAVQAVEAASGGGQADEASTSQ